MRRFIFVRQCQSYQKRTRIILIVTRFLKEMLNKKSIDVEILNIVKIFSKHPICLAILDIIPFVRKIRFITSISILFLCEKRKWKENL